MTTNKYDENLLREMYLNEKLSVEEIALKIDKPVRGVRSKLGSMGIYIKKDYVSKSGNRPVKKRELIDRLIPVLKISPEEADCLEKLTKRVLERILVTSTSVSSVELAKENQS